VRILVTGANGQLGRALRRHLGGHDVVAAGRGDLDVTDPEAVREAVRGWRPAAVVNCAAFTDVDGAEEHPEQASRVNGEAVRHLALACREVRAALVQVSTDYVFDGRLDRPYRIDDPPNPMNVYGASKLQGERYALDLLPEVYVVRTSWLYGIGGRNFVETMLRLGQERAAIKVVTDQRGAPTFADDAARAIADLMWTGRYGIYHVTNQGSTTWFEFAGRIFAAAGMRVEVIPTTSAEFGRPARRPANSMLDPYPLEETIGYLLPRWEDGLARYLVQRRVAVS
jgi:dTDP-4-dehydrorhamnose reductase